MLLSIFLSEIQGTKLSWMQVCITKNRFGNMHGIKQPNIHPWTLLLRKCLQYDTNHPDPPTPPSLAHARPHRRSAATPSKPLLAQYATC